MRNLSGKSKNMNYSKVRFYFVPFSNHLERLHCLFHRALWSEKRMIYLESKRARVGSMWSSQEVNVWSFNQKRLQGEMMGTDGRL